MIEVIFGIINVAIITSFISLGGSRKRCADYYDFLTFNKDMMTGELY